MTKLVRETKESTITVDLALEGSGQYAVATPNRFLSHMLETLTRYAGFDLQLDANGDLDHHLIEDTAIVLGQAFQEAFAKRPCVRIASDTIVMDDAWIDAAVDLVDRPYYAGELPIPIYEHWFRSFATEARMVLHIDVRRGRDTHHVIEGAFKAVGRALKAALAKRDEELSTKGTVARL